jgi:hypothetical protein
MLPIKILCGCGQKYAFEIEPVNGRMPRPVNCPACGADGTAAANEIIAQSLPPPSLPMAAVVRPAAAGAAPGAATAPLPAKRSSKARWMSVSVGVVLLAAAGAGVFWMRNKAPAQPPAAIIKPQAGRVDTRKQNITALEAQIPKVKPQAGNVDTLKQAPDRAALDADIARARKSIQARKAGRIAIGRVILEGTEDPMDVNAQMDILGGGYFATEIKDFGRPLTFRLHGYAPLNLDLSGLEGDMVDLGTVQMKKLAASELRQISGNIVLESGTDFGEVEISLVAESGPINTLSGGTYGRRHMAEAVKVLPDHNGHFAAKGFSPASYYCTIKAPGCVEFAKSVFFDKPEGMDLGMIKLERPRRCSLTYVVADKPPFDIAKKQQSVIPGGGRWKASPEIYGWDLTFPQEDGKIHFGMNYGPCELVDLGQGTLQGCANTTAVPDSNFVRDKIEAIGGHVYLLHQGAWKHWVLFKVESVE